MVSRRGRGTVILVTQEWGGGFLDVQCLSAPGSPPVWSQAVPLHPLPSCFTLRWGGRAGILVRLVLPWPSPAPLIYQLRILPPPSVLSPAHEHPPCKHPPSARLRAGLAPRASALQVSPWH